MIPTYFPQTTISAAEARALAGLFGPLNLLLPSDMETPPVLQDLEREGVVALHHPLADSMDRRLVRAVLAESKLWEQGMAFKETAHSADKIPYFGDTSITGIRDSVRRLAQGREEPSADALLADVLFLHVAQNLDSKHHEMAGAVRQLKEKEERLLRDLAEPGQAAGRLGGLLTDPDDPRERRIERRLSAWSRLAAAASGLGGVFVTTSPNVLELLMDKKQVQPVSFTVEGVSAILDDSSKSPEAGQWRTAFAECMDHYTAGGWDASRTVEDLEALPEMEAGSGGGMHLRVVLFDENPGALFIQNLEQPLQNPPEAASHQHTAVCCVSPRAQE